MDTTTISKSSSEQKQSSSIAIKNEKSNKVLGKYSPRIHHKRPDSMQVELLPQPENSKSEKCIEIFASDAKNDIEFSNLFYSVKEGIFKRRERIILDKISGKFPSGKLTVIMGPSGCGKSSLMNILAGCRIRGCSGEILINGKIRNIDLFKENSYYLMQDDNLQPLLTVSEAINIAAHLQLGKTFSYSDKKKRVKELLEFLDLWKCRKVTTRNLSGGQRKRLAIALELIKNPEVLFLDEPTSGLDSVTSRNCVDLLKSLTTRGKTVVCVIHQPSASIFEMFDHLYVMANGLCMYQGSVTHILRYLDENFLKCPPYHNPADYLIEIASGEHDETAVDRLVKKCDNGRLSIDYSGKFYGRQRSRHQTHEVGTIAKKVINEVGTNYLPHDNEL